MDAALRDCQSAGEPSQPLTLDEIVKIFQSFAETLQASVLAHLNTEKEMLVQQRNWTRLVEFKQQSDLITKHIQACIAFSNPPSVSELHTHVLDLCKLLDRVQDFDSSAYISALTCFHNSEFQDIPDYMYDNIDPSVAPGPARKKQRTDASA